MIIPWLKQDPPLSPTNNFIDDHGTQTTFSFLLANELDALLAWIFTALCRCGIGMALTQLGTALRPRNFGLWRSSVETLVMSGLGYTRFQAADKAIRQGRLPAHGRGPMLQVMGVILFALVVMVLRRHGCTISTGSSCGYLRDGMGSVSGSGR